MTTNPWAKRINALLELCIYVVLLCVIYLAGYSGGRDAAVQAYNNHPACNTNLKP
jgi:heme A synthase